MYVGSVRHSNKETSVGMESLVCIVIGTIIYLYLQVWTVDIASDNSILVSGSQDGTIKLWRLRNGNQVRADNTKEDDLRKEKSISLSLY